MYKEYTCTVWGYQTGGYGFSQCMRSHTHSLTRMSLLSRSSLVNSFSGSGGSGFLQPSTPAQSTSHLPLFPSPSPPSHSPTHSPQVIDKLIQNLAQLALDSVKVVNLHSHLFLHLLQPCFLRGSRNYLFFVVPSFKPSRKTGPFMANVTQSEPCKL